MEIVRRHKTIDPHGSRVCPRGPRPKAGTAGNEAKPLRLRKYWVWLLVASLCLSLAIPFLLGGIGQFELLDRLSWLAMGSFIFLVAVSWAFNSLRTQMLMRATGRGVSFPNAALVTISAEFAGVSTPGSVGMPATYTFLFHNLGVRVGEAIGLVGLIMVTDLIFYGAMMPLAAVVQVFEAGTKHNSFLLAGEVVVVVGGTILALWALVRHYRAVYHFVSRQMGKIRWLAKYRYRLARATVQFIHSLRLVERQSWAWRGGLFLVTVGFWLPRYLIMALAIYLVGAAVPLSYLFLVQGALNLGGQVLMTPGGAGTVGAGYAAFLSPYLGGQSLGFSLLMWRFFTFYWLLIVGGPIFLLKTGKAAHDLLTKKS
ncbi:MAG TPA: lysylphosphatidylglycerol synthase transmembrane domain-containing protein [Desulfobaccales bacterium]|nr:lysylphosphatidylglycerol synthase transmembrane domain-containing protein [Desulfobaccales bacterium]